MATTTIQKNNLRQWRNIMKSFYFLSLILYALTITTDSHCMITALIKRNKIYSPAQRTYCMKQAVLAQRMRHLEALVAEQRLKLEDLERKVGNLNNNNQKFSRNEDLLEWERIHDSYCEKYNAHFPIRDEKN